MGVTDIGVAVAAIAAVAHGSLTGVRQAASKTTVTTKLRKLRMTKPSLPQNHFGTGYTNLAAA